MKFKISQFLIPILMFLFCSGCPTRPIDDMVNRTTRVLRMLVKDLEKESTAWQEKLDETILQLDDQSQKLIKIELSNLLNRTVANAGNVANCHAKLVGRSIIAPIKDLERNVKSVFDKSYTAYDPPIFCSIIPNEIDIADLVNENRNNSIQLNGYNLSSERVKCLLINDNNGKADTIDVTEHLHFSSHGSQVLDLSFNGAKLTKNSRKLIITSDQILVSSIPIKKNYPKCTDEVTLNNLQKTFIPKHKVGDQDFYGHGPEINTNISYSISPDKKRLNLRIWMSARETQSVTYAEGEEEVLIYEAPDNYIIDKILSPTQLKASKRYIDGNTNDDIFEGDSFNPVKRWVFVGDTYGLESGTKTGVTLELNPIKLLLKNISPYCDNPPIGNLISNEPVEVCTCTAKGSLANQKYWGPKGEPCCGLPEWGTYSENCRLLTELYSGKGAGGLGRMTFWGPKGEHVAGLSSWPKFKGKPIKISSTKIPGYLSYCDCAGYGSQMARLRFWGPSGQFCNGLEEWGTFQYNCVKS